MNLDDDYSDLHDRIRDLERVLDAVRFERESEGRAAAEAVARLTGERDGAFAEVTRLRVGVAKIADKLAPQPPGTFDGRLGGMGTVARWLRDLINPEATP